MMKALGSVALSLAAVVVTAGCGGQHQAATGNVSGSLLRVGGPAPGSAVPLAGQVIAVSSDGFRYLAAVGEKGQYKLSLPPGVYRLSGHSPMVEDWRARCTAAHAIRVTADTTTTGLAVICSIR